VLRHIQQPRGRRSHAGGAESGPGTGRVSGAVRGLQGGLLVGDHDGKAAARHAQGALLGGGLDRT
jgi:hypothetical protein